MTDDEVTLAAMHLLARRMGVRTSKRSVLEKHWRKYHPIVHASCRREVRTVNKLEKAMVDVHALLISDTAEALDKAYAIVSGITSGSPLDKGTPDPASNG